MIDFGMAKGDKEKCVVLVTGGTGFLGQHVIKLLNTHADHVTSIKVIDLVPFVNKLDYSPTKPIHHYAGSITDENLMREAMRGCHCVIHLAAIVDYSMFPNKEKLKHVNVQGTVVALKVAQESRTVRRFVGCSSYSVMNDSTNIIDGDEETPVPKQWLFGEYSATKYASERLILEASGPEFQTVVLRPVNMYGELDDVFVTNVLRLASKSGVSFGVNCGEYIHQQAYVGNVAWAFVCAEKKLFSEHKLMYTSTEKKSNLENTSDYVDGEIDKLEKQDSTDDARLNRTTAGHVFFAADDTPNQNMFQFMEYFILSCGFRVSNIKIPYFLVLILLYIVYFLFNILALFGIHLNMDYSIPAVRFMRSSLTFKYEKARKYLDYNPLFTPEAAREKSLHFYQNLVSKVKTK